MDNREAIRDFLSSRRAKISPEQAGVQSFGGKRRVSGLRRGEVAELAGVSVEYYTRLERGNLAGASDLVLDGLVQALQLDDAEREHLFNFARTAALPGGRSRAVKVSPSVQPVVQRILDAMIDVPAFVMNGRLDIIASNNLARTLYSELYVSDTNDGNLARFNFLDPRSVGLYPEWNEAANTTVALLRAEAGRSPMDKNLTDLIGELSTRSDEFRTRWAAHNVRLHRTGVKHFQHPMVGRLDLAFQTMELSGEPGLSLTAYSVEPGSSSEDGLKLLSTWTANVATG